MANLLNEILPVFTTVFGQIGEVASTVIANPILLLGTATGLSVVIVGVFKSIMR